MCSIEKIPRGGNTRKVYSVVESHRRPTDALSEPGSTEGWPAHGADRSPRWRKTQPGRVRWAVPVRFVVTNPPRYITTELTCPAGRWAPAARAGAGCWRLRPQLSAAVNLISDLDCVSTQRLLHDRLPFCIRLVSDPWLV